MRKLAELEQREAERDPVELALLLEEALDILREQDRIEGRQLTLTLPQAPWPLPTISGDRDLLFLSIYNLLDNALKFTQPDDTIEIRAYEDGAALALEVVDTGPGISPAELSHVWEELYRGLLMAALADGSRSATAPIWQAGKGYELYSWPENEQWHFTLMSGTNRLKDYHRIRRELGLA